jgi:hypothetical protein
LKGLIPGERAADLGYDGLVVNWLARCVNDFAIVAAAVVMCVSVLVEGEEVSGTAAGPSGGKTVEAGDAVVLVQFSLAALLVFGMGMPLHGLVTWVLPLTVTAAPGG